MCHLNLPKIFIPLPGQVIDSFYRKQTKLQEGNVFTGVGHSFVHRGVGISGPMSLPGGGCVRGCVCREEGGVGMSREGVHILLEKN